MPREVRAASEADFEALVRLNRLVQNLHAVLYPRDFKPTADEPAVKTFFAERLADPTNGVGVADEDGAPVGYIWFEVQTRPETLFTRPRSRIYLHHISVAPHARRGGIGAALLAYVERRAASDGVDVIALDVWAANLEAQRFFAAQGFAPFNLALRKTLEGAG